MGGANIDPKGIIWINLVEVHKEMLHTKYQSSAPSSFREEEFEACRLCFYVPTYGPWDGVSFDPKGIIWTNLVEVH